MRVPRPPLQHGATERLLARLPDAARRLGINRQLLHDQMKRYGPRAE